MIVPLAIVHGLLITTLVIFGTLSLVESNGNSFIIPIAYAIAYSIAIPLFVIIIVIFSFTCGEERRTRKENYQQWVKRLLKFNFQSKNPFYMNATMTYYYTLFATYAVVVGFYWTWVSQYSFYVAPTFSLPFISLPLEIWISINLISAILNYIAAWYAIDAFSIYLSITFGELDHVPGTIKNHCPAILFTN
jgi:hypothetical protein